MRRLTMDDAYLAAIAGLFAAPRRRRPLSEEEAARLEKQVERDAWNESVEARKAAKRERKRSAKDSR